MIRERIFVAWVSDRPGVLTRIASVFFRLSINIVSLNVASTHTPRVSKMVIRAAGDEHELLRVKRQISRLVDTLRVDVLSTDTAVRSEEHTSELQSRGHLVCRLLLEKKKRQDEHMNTQ